MNDEDEMLKLAAREFGRSGELIPTTNADVEREEHELDPTLELPASLRAYRAPPNSLERARTRRSNRALTHVVAAVLGAAAAWLTFTLGSRRPPVGGGVPTQEPVKAKPDASVEERRGLAPPPTCGAACCAGKSCATPKKDLGECSSGRSCVTCEQGRIDESRYRVRIGAFVPLDAGRAFVEGARTALELCIRAGASELVCAPAHADAGQTEIWSSLPLVVSQGDLTASLSVELRVKGANKSAARWSSAVQLTPSVLCKGLSIKLHDDQNQPLGVLSVFLDDAYFVEIARGADVASLDAERSRYGSDALPALVFETERQGDRRFVLGFGPFDKRSAEAVRWQVLERGGQAELATGTEYRGTALRKP